MKLSQFAVSFKIGCGVGSLEPYAKGIAGKNALLEEEKKRGNWPSVSLKILQKI